MSAAIEYLVRRRSAAKSHRTEAEEEIGRLTDQIETQRQYIAEQTIAIVELDDAIARLGGTGE